MSLHRTDGPARTPRPRRDEIAPGVDGGREAGVERIPLAGAPSGGTTALPRAGFATALAVSAAVHGLVGAALLLNLETALPEVPVPVEAVSVEIVPEDSAQPALPPLELPPPPAEAAGETAPSPPVVPEPPPPGETLPTEEAPPPGVVQPAPDLPAGPPGSATEPTTEMAEPAGEEAEATTATETAETEAGEPPPPPPAEEPAEAAAPPPRGDAGGAGEAGEGGAPGVTPAPPVVPGLTVATSLSADGESGVAEATDPEPAEAAEAAADGEPAPADDAEAAADAAAPEAAAEGTTTVELPELATPAADGTGSDDAAAGGAAGGPVAIALPRPKPPAAARSSARTEQRSGAATAAYTDVVRSAISPAFDRAMRGVLASGVVLVDVRIRRDGSVESVSIAQSSGDASLDGAALTAARETRYPAFAPDMEEEIFWIRMPLRAYSVLRSPQ